MSERFYINCPLEPGPVELDGPEAHHLSAVCRLRPGDEVVLFNGDGADYPAGVISVAKKHVSLDVRARLPVDRERKTPLEIAAPLPKGDRAQFLIEKLTELGVTTFVPLICERSVVQPKEATLEKLARYVIEASKQCGRNVLMRIAPATPWSVHVTTGSPGFFGHPGGGCHAIAGRYAVGPEGGLTDAETSLGLAHGWRAVDLGPAHPSHRNGGNRGGGLGGAEELNFRLPAIASWKHNTKSPSQECSWIAARPGPSR